MNRITVSGAYEQETLDGETYSFISGDDTGNKRYAFALPDGYHPAIGSPIEIEGVATIERIFGAEWIRVDPVYNIKRWRS